MTNYVTLHDKGQSLEFLKRGDKIKALLSFKNGSELAFTCSKWTTETLEKDVKYVQI